jgi:protoporphyrinogen oxidase
VEDQLRTAETTALQMLQDNGFSAAMIDRFFRPFLGGIFLDPTLQTSSRILRFVFRMFAQGDACLPARGMEAIPQQLRSHLPTECVQLHTRVAKVEPGGVILESGVRREARHIVLAVDCRSAAQLLGSSISSDCRGVTCLYFASQRPPVDQPILVLNGERDGLVNNLCVPTVVAPTYGPSHRHLVSATVLGVEQDDAHLCSEVRRELTQWFGSVVNDWRHLRTYRIPHALPDQGPPALTEPQRAVRWQPGIYVCGDHRDTASIQGAMLSGRRAAEAVLEDLHG